MTRIGAGMTNLRDHNACFSHPMEDRLGTSLSLA